jgi:hypothetical protein
MKALRWWALIAILSLGACDRMKDVLDSFSGPGFETTVLAPGPLDVGPDAREITPTEPLNVFGEVASLCIVLKDNVPLAPQDVLAKTFNETLKGADITVSFTTTDNRTFTLPAKDQAWKRSGSGAVGDLSACSSCGCSTEGCRALFPSGSQIRSVRIASTVPLTTRGVYWESANAIDKPANTTRHPASAPNSVLQGDAPALRCSAGVPSPALRARRT